MLLALLVAVLARKKIIEGGGGGGVFLRSKGICVFTDHIKYILPKKEGRGSHLFPSLARSLSRPSVFPFQNYSFSISDFYQFRFTTRILKFYR